MIHPATLESLVVFRVWIIGHRGWAGLLAALLLTAMVLGLAEFEVEGILTEYKFPIWGLYPALIAVVAGTVCSSRLPESHGRDVRLIRARSLWLALVTLFVLGLSGTIALRVDYWNLAWESAYLTVVVFGSSCILGNYSPCLGLILSALVFIYGADSRFIGIEFWYSGSSPIFWWSLVVVVLVGAIGYVFLGPRSGLEHLNADD